LKKLFTMSIYINMPIEVHTFFAILNLVACAVLVIVRIYHQTQKNIEGAKLSATGLSCIFFGFLFCLSLVNVDTGTYFGDDRLCALSLKLEATTYSLHRVLLYIFIIFRLEIVNRSNFMSSWIIIAGKIVIVIIGMLVVVITTLTTEGIMDQYSRCTFHMSNSIIIVCFLFDSLICVGGT